MMSNVLINEKEIKGVFDKINFPVTSLDYAHNVGYELGASSLSNDRLSPYIDKLVNNGIIAKVYDFGEGAGREALYNFVNDEAQISLFGYNLYYNY